MLLVPKHIGIVMDGNRTWARARGLDPAAGYRPGCQAIPPVAREAARLGISALTLYAFSVENWQRPAREIDAIFASLLDMLATEAEALADAGIALRAIGDAAKLPQALQQALARAEALAPANPRTTVAFALNYGGREDIFNAMQRLMIRIEAGETKAADLTQHDLEAGLSTRNLAPLDLIIRAAGQQRLSNFLLWQAAYAELAFDEVLWPDFTPAHLARHVAGFGQRNRSFGR
jgi:undecaprenyl diphosphate synthase